MLSCITSCEVLLYHLPRELAVQDVKNARQKQSKQNFASVDLAAD